MKRIAMCGLVLAFGCHARGPVAPEATTTPSDVNGGAGGVAGAPADATSNESRLLDARATFADVLRQAGRLETDASERDACLAHVTNEGLRLEATIAPAIRPIPDPEPALERRLDETSGVAILSRWGRHGSGALAVATLTHLPPIVEEPIAVVFVTPRRVVVRATADGALATGTSEVSLDALARTFSSSTAAVVVTADAQVTVARLHDVLARLDTTSLPVALGAVLPAGSRLPADAEPHARTNVERCDSLPELPREAQEGDLSVAALRDGVGRVRAAVPSCLAGTSSARVARGGRLELLVRIAPDGEAKLACARADTIEDDGFRMCVVAAARAVRFALPNPPGYVDTAFPLTIAPDSTMANRALCER